MTPNRFDLDALMDDLPDADKVLTDETIYDEVERYYGDVVEIGEAGIAADW